MIERRDAFQAIADPTRRMIIQKLSRGPLNIAQIGEDFGVSRQAIAKHIKILSECGIISTSQKGREQICEARLDQLDEVTDWVNESRKLWNQRFEKLDKFLKEIKKRTVMNSDKKELFITHLFDAPRAVVFRAWTDPEQLKHWYAPDGCTVEFKSIETKQGGNFHSCIHDPVHGECWVKGTYLEVLPDQKLVFTMIMSDEAGNSVSSVKAGKTEDWPEQQVTTVTFEAIAGQTKVSIHQTVSEEEAKKTGAYQSWVNMLNKLDISLK